MIVLTTTGDYDLYLQWWDVPDPIVMTWIGLAGRLGHDFEAAASRDDMVLQASTPPFPWTALSGALAGWWASPEKDLEATWLPCEINLAELLFNQLRNELQENIKAWEKRTGRVLTTDHYAREMFEARDKAINEGLRWIAQQRAGGS
jgi:hypothetical protein